MKLNIGSTDSLAEPLPQFREFRAPRGHGERLIQPELSRAGQSISENRERAEAYPPELSSLRADARAQLLRDAGRYTSAYRNVGPVPTADARIVMAGHQPELFHPGVWFKNFALDHVASATASVAINLVVDSDVSGVNSIRVPSLSAHDGSIGYTTVRYDRGTAGVPYEQSLVQDRQLFDTFDQRVAEALAGIVSRPSVVPLWRHAREAIQRCGFAGCALAQARHGLEAELGLNTLEIPQSVVCRSDAFASFAMHILRDLPRYHRCYNGSADRYRLAHGIRSNAHPVPNLRTEGDWWEAPFWLYGNQSPRRRSVWVRLSRGGKTMEISDRDKRLRTIENADDPSADAAFASLSSPEFKLRSRALVTTMYARLVLSDLFLHGIGGGKYDQLGDLISAAFWNLQPPEMMVISATALLPQAESHSPRDIEQALAALKRRRRDLVYQPERFADSGELPDQLIEEKRSLLASIPARGHRSQWHHQLTELNRQMSSRLRHIEAELDQQFQQLERRSRAASIWNSREHPFCIYPLAGLQDTFRSMLHVG
ncbi:hypothetical protein FYK55_22530 [Roseiconus nitratireducens]|uniref:Uncharacterized protein n=1 Tax=Roseiconus nitratireducens TaxID=2605748 RepID=A0A5M6D4G7_9BACT|nr:hypothetical protein [Roseiconus nitratireducens]KAA5540085.1 hypothetical protein FYK55_22530 [Roseiconus nitratireducens]